MQQANILLTLAVIVFSTLGLLFGSVVNAVVSQSTPGHSSIRWGSVCAHRHPTTAWRSIPLVGWLLTRGKCHECKLSISARYPLTELGTGASFAAVTLALGFSPYLPAFLFFVVLAVAMSVIDLDYRPVPLRLAQTLGIGLLVTAGVAALVERTPQPYVIAIAAGFGLAVFIAGATLVAEFLTEVSGDKINQEKQVLGLSHPAVIPVVTAACGFFAAVVAWEVFACVAAAALFAALSSFDGRKSRSVPAVTVIVSTTFVTVMAAALVTPEVWVPILLWGVLPAAVLGFCLRGRMLVVHALQATVAVFSVAFLAVGTQRYFGAPAWVSLSLTAAAVGGGSLMAYIVDRIEVSTRIQDAEEDAEEAIQTALDATKASEALSLNEDTDGDTEGETEETATEAVEISEVKETLTLTTVEELEKAPPVFATAHRLGALWITLSGILALIFFTLVSLLPALSLVPAFAALSVGGVALFVLDVRVRRLPFDILLWLYPVVVVLLFGSTFFGQSIELTRLLTSTALWISMFLVPFVVTKGRGMGFGDVMLAPLMGFSLGWIGWGASIVGLMSGFLLAMMYAIALMITGRAKLKSAVAYGPFMLGGALFGACCGGVILLKYASIFGLA